MVRKKPLSKESLEALCGDYVYFDDSPKEIAENYGVDPGKVGKQVRRGIKLGIVTGQQYKSAKSRKIADSQRGKTLSEEHRRKISKANSGENNPHHGKKHSEETRRKISNANKGKRTSVKYSDDLVAAFAQDYVYFDEPISELREMYGLSPGAFVSRIMKRAQKLGVIDQEDYNAASCRRKSLSHKGIKLSESHRRKIKDANTKLTSEKMDELLELVRNEMEKYKTVEIESLSTAEELGNLFGVSRGPIRKGLGHLSESERKDRIDSLVKRGENHPNYNGGRSSIPYTRIFTDVMRSLIREREGYACRNCGIPEGKKAHDVHHIDYDKCNDDVRNLILLCRGCHSPTNAANGDRAIWTELYQEVVQEIYANMPEGRKEELEKMRLDLMREHCLEEAVA